MDSLVAHYTFKNNVKDSRGNFHGEVTGNPKYVSNKDQEGIVFEKGDVVNINPISLAGDYSIAVWFEFPLPDNVWDFNSLCSGDGADSHVPVLVKNANKHLGVFNSAPYVGGFVDSGFDLNCLDQGRHHLIAIGDAKTNSTVFYINNEQVGVSNFKSDTKIIQIGNNGNEKVGFLQPFGFVTDFRIYNKKLNFEERSLLFSNLQKQQMPSNSKMGNKDNSINLHNITKTFKLYHEKRNSLFEYLTSIFDKKKYYDELIVLKDISFNVKKGEMLGIIGLNGSGKSTLLKIISKIYSPDSGSIISNGKIIPFLGLGAGLNPELTARDNIIIYGVILGFTKKEIEAKIDKIVKFAELERFLDTKLKNFSSGMHSRLSFSTAIEVDPDILLVDEVLSVGDLSFQEKSFNAFMNFKKRGKTIVFVSHAIDQIEKHCDKALWLHDGLVQEYGNPKSVIEKYKQFVSVIKLNNI